MHEQSPVLQGQVRGRLGSRYAKRERNLGRLPAVLYGHKQDPVALTLDAKETITWIHKGEKVFQLRLDGAEGGSGGGEQMVLLKDVQFDYLGTNIIHADFARVNMDERVHTRVHVKLIGDPVGLKTAGTVFVHPTTELEVECRVTDMPDFIEVDVSALDVGHVITAGEIALPGDMKLLTDGHAVLAQVALAGGAETATGEAGAVEAGVAEPEVIKEKQAEERAAAKAKPEEGKKK